MTMRCQQHVAVNKGIGRGHVLLFGGAHHIGKLSALGLLGKELLSVLSSKCVPCDDVVKG